MIGAIPRPRYMTHEYSKGTVVTDISNIPSISQFKSSKRTQGNTTVSRVSQVSGERVYGQSEMDSQADTIVAGKKCIVMNHTSRSCEVMPYSDQYDLLKDVSIVRAAIGYRSSNGQGYILILNEALHMSGLDHRVRV